MLHSACSPTALSDVATSSDCVDASTYSFGDAKTAAPCGGECTTCGTLPRRRCVGRSLKILAILLRASRRAARSLDRITFEVFHPEAPITDFFAMASDQTQLHRDTAYSGTQTDCTVTCAKMATDNSLRGRRFRDTVPGPPPTQPTGWAGGGPAWVYRTDGAGPRPAPFPSPTPGLPGSAFVPALTLIMRRQTHKGIAHKGIFLGSRIVDTPAKNHRKSVVGGGPAAGNRR